MKGHYTPNPLWTNEVWGLAALNMVHPKGERFLTCSDDATLRLFSTKLRKCITMKRFDVKDFNDLSSKKKPYVKIKEAVAQYSSALELQVSSDVID